MTHTRNSGRSFVRRTSPPLEQKVTFLAMTDIGDERPSEFAMELQHLLANVSIDDVLNVDVLMTCSACHRRSSRRSRQPRRKIPDCHPGSGQGLDSGIGCCKRPCADSFCRSGYRTSGCVIKRQQARGASTRIPTDRDDNNCRSVVPGEARRGVERDEAP